MNRCRRMAALQARALAHAGWRVLQVDLCGCGDSDGDFGEATWSRWVDDVRAACAWLDERFGPVAWVWALRAGCLVAVDAAGSMSAAPDLLFWQPVLSGRQFLQHLLRLRIASELVGGRGAGRSDTRELRAQLVQGQSIEIAGYELSPALALGLEAASLTPLSNPVRVAWLEVASEGTELAPGAQKSVDAWQQSNHVVTTRSVAGPAFWQTQEIAECPELIRATLDVLEVAQK